MRHFLRILFEGAVQAWQQLMANKLRSFLSLLGVTIGIFCIIGVKSSVNSLEANIRRSVARLGNDILYFDRFSWAEDPGQNYWKWMRNPLFSYDEFKAVQRKSNLVQEIGFYQIMGSKTVKWKSSSVENVAFMAITDDCQSLFNLELENETGRFFSPVESMSGADVCLIGYNVAEGLFGEGVNPLDKQVSVGGRKLRVLGVLKKSGDDILKVMNFDDVVVISYNLARRGFRVRANRWGGSYMLARAEPGVDMEELKGEVTGILRAERSLKPREDNNFHLNTLSILSGLFDSLFGTINGAGLFIGAFALLVGMFSVANIMFVSVRERTNLIGIKMALGARRWFILLEILFEAVVLCLFGGLLGLVFIWLATMLISNAIDFEIFVSLDNVLFGIVTSVIVGVLSGLIPAFQASSMDPVEAIRK